MSEVPLQREMAQRGRGEGGSIGLYNVVQLQKLGAASLGAELRQEPNGPSGNTPRTVGKGCWSHCFSPAVDYWSYCPTPHFPFPTTGVTRN